MIKDLCKLIVDRCDKETCFVTAGVGFSSLQTIKERFDKRFIDAGIAEANMIGVASGLATENRKVFTYSMACFISSRCLEQIKLDVAYHNKNVCIIGNGSGYYYSNQGVSHHSVDDVAFVSSIPEMRIFNPGNLQELKECFSEIIAHNGPSYIRIGRVVDDAFLRLKIKKGDGLNELLSGDKLTVITSGTILQNFDLSLDILGLQIISCPEISNINIDKLINVISSKKLLVVEEVISNGSLGDKLSRRILERGKMFDYFGIKNITSEFSKKFGSEIYMREQLGFGPVCLRNKIIEIINE